MQWTVRFTDYMKFEGVKDAIRQMKNVKKTQKDWASTAYGSMLEETVATIVEDGNILTVDKLAPQYDMGFGADLKFNYKKEDKNYSFFVDVTARTYDSTKYFGLNGELVDDQSKAFCYYTNEFSLYFSVKYHHHGFFFYEKPVVSLIVKTFGPEINLENVELSHSTNISNVLVALHEHLVEQGYGARASHYIQPNKSRFLDQYKQFVKENRDV